MRTTVLNCFCVKAAESAHYQHSLRFLSEDGRLSKRHVCGSWKKALKNTILWNYIEIKQLGIENDVIKMKSEYHSKWFSTIHCRRPR